MDDAWVGPLYWIQWAGGHRRLHPRGRRTGPGGEVASPGLCACRAARGLCTERARACPHDTDLAENRPSFSRAICPPTMALEGALGVFGERIGGAFASRTPCPARGPQAYAGVHRGAFPASQAAPPALRQASFMAAW